MHQLFRIIFSTSFAFAILRISTPIILAGMAAVISERAGVVNIAIEGMMLTGALTGVIFSAFTGSWVVGLLSSIIISILISLILAYFTLNLKANIIMCGLAINIMAKGGTVFVLYLLTGNKGASTGLKSYSVPDVNIPVLKEIPVLGAIFSGHNLLTYLSIVIVFLLHIFMFRSKTGMRIRAVGENPDAVKSVGISVRKVQYYALALSGLFSGIAGAFMSMGYMNGFTANMVSGRGFIALAANSMGQNTPWGTFFASLIFGCADAASNSLQVLKIPTQFIQMIPYVRQFWVLRFIALQLLTK
jgi:simple sugar transport system permease protein